MTPLLRSHYEKLLLATSVAAVAASANWAWRMETEVERVRAEREGPMLDGALPAAITRPAPGADRVWDKPPVQSEGGGWLYEVFTPPEIYFNATARSFAVTPPRYAAEADGTVFGLELLAVRREPYRLQLKGYFGSPGDYLAAFVSRELPQTLFAREGRRLANLGLTLRRFDVRKIEVPAAGGGPGYDVAAVAVVFDEQSGTEVELDSRGPKFTDTPLAVFQSPDGGGRSRELHEGDTYRDEEATYRVERIQLDPPEVVVTRVTPGASVPELRVLRPAATERIATATPPNSSDHHPRPPVAARNP